MSSEMPENIDPDTIDLERLALELEKFDKILKEGEESDGGESMEQTGSRQAAHTYLDKYLQSIARTGDPLLPWKKVKNFIHHKIDSILTSFYVKFGIEDIDSQNLPPFNYLPAKEKLLQHFDSFTGAPFTIQRLCEILTDPGRHYRRTDKLLRGLEKNILVVSTIGRLSEDCSNPQQRLTLFNGLQMSNSFRPHRPPLPHHLDKFQSPRSSKQRRHKVKCSREKGKHSRTKTETSPDIERVTHLNIIIEKAPEELERPMRPKLSAHDIIAFRNSLEMLEDSTKDEEDVGTRKRALHDDANSMEDDEEETFDDECLKQDLDDEQIEDMDDEVKGSGSEREPEGYGVSINSVMWRKRKEDQQTENRYKKLKTSDVGSRESSTSPRLSAIVKALDEVTCESSADDSMEVDEEARSSCAGTEDAPEQRDEETSDESKDDEQNSCDATESKDDVKLPQSPCKMPDDEKLSKSPTKEEKDEAQSSKKHVEGKDECLKSLDNDVQQDKDLTKRTTKRIRDDKELSKISSKEQEDKESSKTPCKDAQVKELEHPKSKINVKDDVKISVPTAACAQQLPKRTESKSSAATSDKPSDTKADQDNEKASLKDLTDETKLFSGECDPADVGDDAADVDDDDAAADAGDDTTDARDDTTDAGDDTTDVENDATDAADDTTDARDEISDARDDATAAEDDTADVGTVDGALADPVASGDSPGNQEALEEKN
ncbi:serine/threonine-protein phosphatase 4 regulatory subunit 2-B isoform X2 [Hyalella azteca]|uniref:Serine/threonine-protein phosphatase 4 regulatory subunit 2-B isoform X2 n=1 Tax=Hyalella azteca TaxID=294128 RepID=A0A8B7NH11_HYAAZ|nr:serine/threonine-protein phosphatase 4 regulatory subunit 2-B isoform X2 [Hyalella azteca]